ncbi:MAG TPA: hypothetical protein VFQ77_15365 [Pseudonocardiaceae bacterium]|nr:hypothetical protein [Pseudonocardiaceae bacterium]
MDESALRDLVESEARQDAASGMYDVNLGTHGHPLIMEHKIDRWNHRWSAAAELRQQQDRRIAQRRYRLATRSRATGEMAQRHLEQDLQDALAYRDRMAGIVAGREPGDDGGFWPAESRIDEDRRAEVGKDWAIYLGATFAEIGLNYTAFQLMGSSLQETAVLAASIILVNVLLPKQLGELVARVRRAQRGRAALLAGLLGGALLWVGVSVFVAQVRTAYLLLPSAAAQQTGATSLLERAGLGAVTLTVGWLLVVLAVGMVVLLRSATRYNPYLKNLRTARARVDKLRAALVHQHGDVVVARFDLDRTNEPEADLAEQWAGTRAAQDGFAAELKHHYQHHLTRNLANPTITDGVEIAVGRTHLRPEPGELNR